MIATPPQSPPTPTTRSLRAQQQPSHRRHQHQPLPFRSWFARRALKSDLLFISSELILSNVIHITKQLSTLMCVPAAGCSLGRALLDLQQPPFDPAARRADALLAGFPCGESYINQLLYTLRTGAVLDPRLRLRLCDLHNLAYLLTHLATLAVAVAAPSLYVRCRHFLFLAIQVVSLLGAHLSTSLAPDALFPLGAAALMSSRICLVSAFYYSWKSASVLQMTRANVLLLDGRRVRKNSKSRAAAAGQFLRALLYVVASKCRKHACASDAFICIAYILIQ
ncbi:hypothetical protein PLESTB_001110200 [Pleodorina starrii]|uniref:Uncharacterized protein n=1 Tax=Pleodorina starrii TaxID=330485 RepID=A0A9W6BQV1_9CHLO|nr:hypothetical protein PLESTB_001110200 [Pleodorina starrii]